MTFRRFAAAVLLASLVAACSGSGVAVPATPRSEALEDALDAQPEMADALAKIEAGECDQVLPMLTMYAGHDERSQLLDYLLGRGYACNGDWTKAVFHLRRAWQADKALRPDIRQAARQAAQTLTAHYDDAGALSFPQAKAAAGLYAFGEDGWYSKSASALLQGFVEKQFGRGDYSGALRTVTVLKRIGAPLGETFELEVRARVRLGQVDRVKTLVEADAARLGAEQPAILHRLGAAAEAAYRHDMAAWLYARCKTAGCPNAQVGLDLTRALLKANRADEARIEYRDFLAETPREQIGERSLAMAELLQRYDRFAEAFEVLSDAIKLQATDFALVKAAAALHDKLPGTVNVTVLFAGYMKALGTTREALVQVGEQCIEWKLPNPCLPLLPALDETTHDDLVNFYRGAFQWMSALKEKAEDSFAAAVKSAQDKAEMLGRTADFYLRVGELDQARSTLERALREDRDAIGVMLKLASLLEDEKGGSGLKMLQRRIGRKAAPEASLAAANWCRDRSELKDAMTFARRAVAGASGETLASANLLLGHLLREGGDEPGALAAYDQAFAHATDSARVATEVFGRDVATMSGQFACFVARHAARINADGKLPDGQLEVGALAAMRCGKPDNALLQAYVSRARLPAQAYLNLFGAVQGQAGRLALAELEAAWPANAVMTSPLLEQLVLLFAHLQDNARTSRYAHQLVRTGGVARRDQYAALAARILPEGQMDAARELLRAAFEFGYAARGGAGSEHAVTYAGLLFANGEDDQGMTVLRTMLKAGLDPSDAVAAATLLIDAHKYQLAFDIAMEAVHRFAEVRAEPTGLPGEPGERLDPRKLSKADLMALLQKRPVLDPGEARQQLVGLAAFAWNELGQPWDAFVEQMRKAVRPFNGEDLLAVALHRLGATAPALALLEEAFDEAPAELALFKAFCDALVYDDYIRDQKLDTSAPRLEAVARRFVKAREGDPDAYRLAAGYLEGKGFFKAASKLLNDLADSTSVDGPLALALGRNLLSQGKDAEAATQFSLAAQLSACHQKTVDPIVEELQRVARLDLAVEIVQECARRFPKDAYLQLTMARVLLNSNGKAVDPDGTTTALQKAVALDDRLLPDVVGLLHSQEKWDEAWPFIELMARSKDHEMALKALEVGFEVASQTGDVDRMTRLGSIASRSQRDPQVASELASVYFKYNLPEQGLAKLKALEGKDDVSALLLGIRMITNGQTKAGLKRLHAHSDLLFKGRKPDTGPMNAKDFRPLSVQLDFLEDMELNGEAIDLLRKALIAFPEDARLRLRLVERLTVAGEFKEVAGMVSRVVREWPGGEERKRLVRVLERFRSTGRLGELRDQLKANCPSLAEEGCMLPLLLAAAMEQDNATVQELVDAAMDSALPAIRLADLGDELVTLGYYGQGEKLLVASLARTVGRPTPVLAQVHRLLARIYSATGRRDQVDELNRLFLLHPATRAELRSELPENLVDYEYLEAADQQFRLLALTMQDALKAELALFDIKLRKQDYEGARSLALRSAFRAENVLNALLTYASLARRKLVFDVALELYQAAHALDPTNQALLFALAELELVLGRTEAAFQHFQEYQGKGPGKVARTAEIVRNLAKYDALGLAAREAEAVGTTEPLLEVALNMFRAGAKSQAVRLMDLAYKAAGKDADRLARTLLLFGVNRPYLLPDATVSKAMKLACTGSTSPAVCRFYEGLALLDSGKARDAAKRFETQLTGSNQTWLFTLGAMRALVRKGEDKLAEQLLRQRMMGFNEVQVLNEAVKTVAALFEEESLSDSGKAAALRLGERLVDGLLKHAPYDFWFRTQKAELMLLGGDSRRASQMYRSYLQDTPWDPGLRNNIAYLLAKLGKDLPQALQLVEEALAREASHSAFYLDTEGWVRFKMGQHEEAEKLIRAALLRSHLGFGDSLAESLYHLGKVLLERQQREPAFQTLKIASFLDPYGEYGRMAREILVEQNVDVYGLEVSN